MRKFLLFIFISSVIILHGCVSVPSSRITATSDFLLNDLCKDYGIRLNWNSIDQSATLSRGDVTAKVMVESRSVIVKGERVILGASVKKRRGLVFVPYDFKSKIIDRFFKKLETVVPYFKTIVIDPGHGGKDPGATGCSGLEEKTLVLDIAKRLGSDLKKNGINVIMTRTEDKYLSLKQRADIANRMNADLFISIHANSSPSSTADGLEVYYLRNIDSLFRKQLFSEVSHNAMFKHLAMDKDNAVLNKILLDMLYVNKQSKSKHLAQYISTSVADDLHLRNRGYKSSGFAVLRNTLIPAVLVEVGFLSNHHEEKLLKTASYRQQVADSIAKSVLKYGHK